MASPSSPGRTRLRTTFRALRVRNFRLYFVGQAVSLTGNWMQRLAQEWLVLELTGSGAWLGIVAALQFLPLLVLGPWGGLLADRIDKHRLIVATQVAASALALVLGLLTLSGAVTLWMVAALALGLGIVAALDKPARHGFVVEMVGDEDLINAVTLHSVIVNAARAVGPAVAGVLIATVGLGWSFVVNAATYLVVIAALVAMDRSVLRTPVPTPRGPRQLRDGFAHVWRTPVLRDALVVMAVAGMLAYEFTVTLPLLARFDFDGDAATLGALNTAMGLGAVVGGLAAANAPSPTESRLLRGAVGFAVAMLATAVAPNLAVATVTLAFVGASSIRFLATGNALLQLRAGPDYRGRVMAMWAIAFLGTTPIGAPVIGLIGEHLGARWALGTGAVATVAAVAFVRARRRRADDRAGAPLAPEPVAGSTQA